jgi:hypothetical protein
MRRNIRNILTSSSLKIIIHHFKLLYVFATMARGML